MDDRTLLELAAKAAGSIIDWRVPQNAPDCPASFIDGKRWNPLTDDGDALRLAVRLQLYHQKITDFPDGTRGISIGIINGNWINYLHEQFMDASAYRRLIVKAAAAIGEAMP